MSLRWLSHDRTTTPSSQRRATLLLGLVTLVIVSGTIGLSGPWLLQSAPPLSSLHATAALPSNATPTAQFPTPIQHVFTIVLENAGLTTILSQGAYLKTLYDDYAGASNYYGVCHPSAPNYLALTSGKLLQCGTDNVNSYSVTNIADLVAAKGESWAAYMQSMPSPCFANWYNNLYKPGHNPFIYYSDLGSSGACAAHDLPLTSFNPSQTPPNYVFFAPNLLNDGHNTSVGYADKWLKGYLPTLLAEPWASSTVFFIVYDEGPSGDSSGYDGLDGGHTYLTAISPYTLGTGLYTADASPYSLLSTTEWLLGTGNTGANDAKSQFAPMKGMFNITSPPTKYPLTGKVDAAGSGAPVVGATLSIPGIPSTSTNSTGGYSFTLLNGSYTVTVSASGYDAGKASVTISGAAVQQNFALVSSAQPQYRLSGLVKSATGGSPITGATVSIPGIPSTSTNSSGGYAFMLLNGSYRVTASAAGYDTSTASVTVAGAPLQQNFALVTSVQSQYPLSGTVAWATNRSAIAGADVFVSNVSSTTTDQRGFYSFNLVNGTYNVSAVAGGAHGSDATITVLGSPVSLNFSLSVIPEAEFVLSGTVMYASNSTPVSGAIVTLAGGGSDAIGSNGSYAFSVPNGTYAITIAQPGFYAEEAIVDVSGSAQFDLFELYPFLYQIEGAVLSQDTGTPLVGANVSLSPTVWQFAGAQGAYDFWVPNGTYNLRVDFQGYDSASVSFGLHGIPVTQNLTLVAGETPTVPTPSNNPSPGFFSGSWVIGGVVAELAIIGALLGLFGRWMLRPKRAKIR